MTTASGQLPQVAQGSQPYDEVVELLHSKAADLFHEKGYAATSMNDVAKAMKMTKAGLYYYTKGKEELLYQILDRSISWVETMVMEPARKIEDPEQRLRFIITEYGGRMLSSERSILLALDEAKGLSPARRRIIDSRNGVYVDLVHDTIEALKTQGKLRAVSSMVGTFSFFAMLLAIPHWYPTKSPIPQDIALRQITTVLVNGLLAGGDQP